MADIIKIAVFVLVWEFIVGVSFVVGNVMIFEYVEPTFDDIANNSGLVSDYATYEARKAPILMGFEVALFILAILPFVYLFVRVLLKREQTSPVYYPPVYSVNPGIRAARSPEGLTITGGGTDVGL